MMKKENELLKLLKRNPVLSILFFAESMLNVAEVYAPLFLIAPLLQSILEKSGNDVLKFAIGYCCAITVTRIIHSYIKESRISISVKLSEDIINRIYSKICSIKYTEYDRPDIKEKCHSAIENMYYNFDYSDLIDSYVKIFENILNAICATFLAIDLLIAFPKIKNNYALIAQPMISITIYFSVLVVVLYIIHVYTSSKREKIKKLIPKHAQVENRLMYLQNNIVFNFEYYISYAIFNMTKIFKPKFEENTHENVSFYDEVRCTQQRIGNAYNVAGAIFSFCAFFLTFIKIYSGAVSITMFVTYAVGISKVYESILAIQSSYEQIKMALPYSDSINEIWAIDDEKSVENKYFLNDGVSKIKFENVYYKYPGESNYAVKNFSIELDSDKVHVIVGKNGGGKTTVILLLLRFLEPEKGTIYVNDIDISKYDIITYRRAFSVAFQNTKIYPISIKDYIILGKEFIEDKYVKAMSMAGINVDAYWTKRDRKELSNRKYSMGEQEKITVASVFYRDTDVYIFDEPTAAMDAYNEEKFFKQIETLKKDHIVIMITHRMSCCKGCEDIIVIDDGLITQRGNHIDLYSKPGVYHELWDAQAETYL